jgi:hypothetical protein
VTSATTNISEEECKNEGSSTSTLSRKDLIDGKTSKIED